MPYGGLTGALPQRLTQVGRALTYATSLEETLRLTVECARDLLESGPILLMLKNNEGLLEIRASHGFDESTRRRFAGPMDELLIERLQDVFGPIAAELFVGVPLVVGGEVTGLLAATRAPDSDPAEAEWLLSALADQASIALEPARDAEAAALIRSQLKSVEAVATSREQALRVISHDLRTPLSTMVSYAELLDSGMLGPLSERQHAAIGHMRESGRHLIALLQNVLEMTRLTAGVIEIEPRAFDLATAVREAVDVAVAPRAPAHRIEIQADKEVIVYADPVRVRQVIIQLFDNAIKYTPAGCRISAACCQEAVEGRPYGTLRIEDNGPGIEPEKLEQIFEPYQRAVNRSGDIPAGSGLGLAIARTLLQQMGGGIDVTSRVGQGTTFTIRLPLPGPVDIAPG